MSLLEKASLVVTPNAYKESKLYSVIPNTTLGDMDVVRATTATRVNEQGLIEVVPRNLLTYSNDFNNGVWGKQNSSITPNYGISPDGAQNASLIQDTIGNSTQYRIYQNLSGSNNKFTITLYVKRLNGTKNAYIDLGPYTAYFNFTTESIYSASGTASFTKLSNDWYRINLSSPLNYNLTTVYMGFASGNSETYTSDGTNQMLFYGAQLEQGSTATTYFPTTDRLNIPRIDYTNGSCPSLLVEPQRTNLYFPSIPNNSANGTLSANVVISPDGTQNASSFLPSGTGLVWSNTITTISQNYTYSVYLKGTVNAQKVKLGTNTATLTEFTLTTSWKRYSFTFLANSESTSYYILSGDFFSPAENNLFYIYGAQLEAGSYATSYIPTVASSVTRNADVISKTGISSLIGQTEGTIFFDGYFNDTQTGTVFLDLEGTFPKVNFQISGGILYFYSQGEFSFFTPISLNTRYKIAGAYKNNDIAFYVNGILIGTDALATITPKTDLYINSVAGSFVADLDINSAQLYKTRLTNSELAQLTTI